MKLVPKIALSGLFGLFLLGAEAPAQAQINININSPSWGPPVTSSNVQYYYIPEVEGYYDLRAQNYVYQRDGRWMRAASLNGYNPNTFHPVIIDYVGTQPWVRIKEYKVKYPKGGHPHGMPPGQAKKMKGGAVYVVPANQVYEQGGKGKEHGNGKGHGKH